MDKTLAETVYRLSTKFSERPYQFLAPNLTREQNMLSIDIAVEAYGLQHEIEMQNEIQKEMARREKKQKRNRR